MCLWFWSKKGSLLNSHGQSIQACLQGIQSERLVLNYISWDGSKNWWRGFRDVMYSIWHHNDMIRDKIRLNYCNFDRMQLCLFFVVNTFFVFVVQNLKFHHIWSCGGKFEFFLITCNSTPFFPIEMKFSLWQKCLYRFAFQIF